MAVGLVTVLLTLAVSAGDNSREALATLSHWEGLQRIGGRLRSLPSMGEETTFAQFAEVQLARAAALRSSARQISSLPVASVDAEALELSDSYRQALVGHADLCDELAYWCADVNRYEQMHEFSVANTAVAFMRGFLGDPLGPVNEQLAEAKDLESARRGLREKAEKVRQRNSALVAEMGRVRAILSTDTIARFPV